jgi:S-formylglutathione hydrolase FrmB
VHEALTDPSIGGNPVELANRMAIGGTMEAAVRDCTVPLVDRLQTLAVPATVVYRDGTHAWPYWQDDLHAFWNVAAPALGV